MRRRREGRRRSKGLWWRCSPPGGGRGERARSQEKLAQIKSKELEVEATHPVHQHRGLQVAHGPQLVQPDRRMDGRREQVSLGAKPVKLDCCDGGESPCGWWRAAAPSTGSQRRRPLRGRSQRRPGVSSVPLKCSKSINKKKPLPTCYQTVNQPGIVAVGRVKWSKSWKVFNTDAFF